MSNEIRKTEDKINEMNPIDKVALIYIKDGKILMALNKGNDVYYLPGGKRNGGETDEETLTREIKEELGVDIIRRTINRYGVFRAQAHGKPQGVVVEMNCYTAEFMGEINPGCEICDVSYYSYAQKHMAGPVDRLIFDDLKSKDFID